MAGVKGSKISLAFTGSDKFNWNIIIETGTDKGWSTEILANIFDKVYTCEIDEERWNYYDELLKNPKIEVEIGANVAGLTAGVNTATGQLDKLGKAAQATAPQVDRLAKATSSYNSVGIDFARIIQDAPFGIIGVGNNITQLAGSFQNLGKAGDTLEQK